MESKVSRRACKGEFDDLFRSHSSVFCLCVLQMWSRRLVPKQNNPILFFVTPMLYQVYILDGLFSKSRVYICMRCVCFVNIVSRSLPAESESTQGVAPFLVRFQPGVRVRLRQVENAPPPLPPRPRAEQFIPYFLISRPHAPFALSSRYPTCLATEGGGGQRFPGPCHHRQARSVRRALRKGEFFLSGPTECTYIAPRDGALVFIYYWRGGGGVTHYHAWP